MISQHCKQPSTPIPRPCVSVASFSVYLEGCGIVAVIGGLSPEQSNFQVDAALCHNETTLYEWMRLLP